MVAYAQAQVRDGAMRDPRRRGGMKSLRRPRGPGEVFTRSRLVDADRGKPTGTGPHRVSRPSPPCQSSDRDHRSTASAVVAECSSSIVKWSPVTSAAS